MWPRASASTIHPRTNDFVSPQPQNLSVTEIKWRSLLAAAPPFLGTVGHLEGPGLPCPQGSLWPGLQLAAPAGSRACCSKLRTEPAPTSVLRIKMNCSSCPAEAGAQAHVEEGLLQSSRARAAPEHGLTSAPRISLSTGDVFKQLGQLRSGRAGPGHA